MDSINSRDWNDNEIIPISALEHYLYCKRQCALIHNEGIFTDNVLTISGNLDHERVDTESCFYEHNVRKETSFPVYSSKYGITGIIDVVEFLNDGNIYPIDHKHGRKIIWEQAAVQLCAYVLCIEEMFNVAINRGAIYHASSKKRSEINIDEKLRKKTQTAIIETRELLISGYLPQAEYGSICKNCSLINDCMPGIDIHKTYINLYKVEDYD